MFLDFRSAGEVKEKASILNQKMCVCFVCLCTCVRVLGNSQTNSLRLWSQFL